MYMGLSKVVGTQMLVEMIIGSLHGTPKGCVGFDVKCISGVHLIQFRHFCPCLITFTPLYTDCNLVSSSLSGTKGLTSWPISG